MTPHPATAMTEATRLTREGRLAEAAALIQRALGGSAPPAPSFDAPRDASAAGSRRLVLDIDPATGAFVGAPRPAGRAPGGAGVLDGLLDRLRAKGMPQDPGTGPHWPPGREAEPAPPGARFAPGVFTGAAGRLSYKLYIPAARKTGGPPPLLVMLHGCTQTPDDFAAGTRMNALAEEHGLLVAYPAQSQAANAQRCWNWFNPADQGRDGGEPALIAGFTRDILRGHGADPLRVYVAGLSAGGAQAAIMGRAYPDLYAAIGVHSGLACGAARDVPSAFAAMRGGGLGAGGPVPRAGGAATMPTIVFHANQDTTVHPVNGDRVMEQAGVEAARAGGLRRGEEVGEVPGGHRWRRTTHSDAEGRVVLEQWLVEGAGHAWSGGSPAGSYTDPRGPDASREMLRFFLGHRLA